MRHCRLPSALAVMFMMASGTCRASLDGLHTEVAAAKAAVKEAVQQEADAEKRAEAAGQRVAELKRRQDELRSEEDADEQRIQVRVQGFV